MIQEIAPTSDFNVAQTRFGVNHNPEYASVAPPAYRANGAMPGSGLPGAFSVEDGLLPLDRTVALDWSEVLVPDPAKEFEEFYWNALNSSEVPLEKPTESGKMDTRAVTGAYSSKNDPDGKKREAHAKCYYDAIRNSNKKDVVSAVAKNSGLDYEIISQVYDHLFINEYDLDKGHTRFDPDYDIAESIQRLRLGKDIQKHDITLIYHEAFEYELMHFGEMSYDDAHEIANQSYNYQKDLDDWLDQNKK